MLNSYLTATQQLLNNSNASGVLYNTGDLTSYINQGRTQLAAEAECVRYYAALPTVNARRVYQFSVVDTGTSGVTGILGVNSVRSISRTSGAGAVFMTPRNWEWFNLYHLCVPVAATGKPLVWAQYAQGQNGSIYVDPIPDAIYGLNLDTTCIPVDLVDDATVEAIPGPWTNAVPYYAAYLACFQAQRPMDAENFLRSYELFVHRARQITTPSVVPGQYPGGEGARGAASRTVLTG